MYYFYTVACVLGISIGQILFKQAANGFNRTGSIFDPVSLSYLMLALVLYAITTLGWVYILRHLSLIRAYPFMALAFVIVPLLAFLFLGESVSTGYLLGVFLIAVGIIFTSL